MSLYIKSLEIISQEIIDKYENEHPLVSIIMLKGVGNGKTCSFIIKPYCYGNSFVKLVQNLTNLSEFGILEHTKSTDGTGLNEEELAKKEVFYTTLYENLKMNILYPDFTLDDIKEDMDNDPIFLYRIHEYIESNYSYERIPIHNMISSMFPDILIEEEDKRDQNFITKYKLLMKDHPYSLPIKYSILQGHCAFYCIINKLNYTQKRTYHKKLSSLSFTIWKKVFLKNGKPETLKIYDYINTFLTSDFILIKHDILTEYQQTHGDVLEDDYINKIEQYNNMMLEDFDNIHSKFVIEEINNNIIYKEPNLDVAKMPFGMVDILLSAMTTSINFEIKDLEDDRLVDSKQFTIPQEE